VGLCMCIVIQDRIARFKQLMPLPDSIWEHYVAQFRPDVSKTGLKTRELAVSLQD